MTNTNHAAELRSLINNANNILITSHVSPDPDSVCSILLLGTTLEANFPDKNISMISEELPDNLNFLPGFSKIKSQKLAGAIAGKDLIVIVDAMNFGRCTRGDFNALSLEVKDKNIPVVIIDHHEPVDVLDNAAYINEMFPAAVEQVYEVCFNQLNLAKPKSFAEITMTGLYSDTGGFTYLNGHYKETLKLIGELIDQGSNIEEVKNRLYQFREPQMKVVAELANNVAHNDSYTYTYLSDAFIAKWTVSGNSLQMMHSATKIFTDNFIRNIEGRRWGFLVYKDSRLGEDKYSISFRSVGGMPNVSEIATKLEGGGHKAASGARVHAKNVQEAIQKIQQVIKTIL
jgi:phosphoesterase RecJ-like protein